MYLRSQADVATPLDWMGPWPVYIGVGRGRGARRSSTSSRCRSGASGGRRARGLMDPLTQGLLGASVRPGALRPQAREGGAHLGRARRRWRRTSTWSRTPLSPMAEWLWHRGPTHALWFGPVVGPALGWLLWKRKGGTAARLGRASPSSRSSPTRCSTSSRATARSCSGPSRAARSPSTRWRSSTPPTASCSRSALVLGLRRGADDGGRASRPGPRSSCPRRTSASASA